MASTKKIRFIVQSERIAQFAVYCVNVPGSCPPRQGEFTFATNVEYEIEEETAIALKKQYDSFSPKVKALLSFQFHDVLESVEIPSTQTPSPSPTPTQSPSPTQASSKDLYVKDMTWAASDGSLFVQTVDTSGNIVVTPVINSGNP